MSISFFKSVWADNPLERRCRFILALCLFVVIGGGFYWYGGKSEQQFRQVTRTAARGMVDSALLNTTW